MLRASCFSISSDFWIIVISSGPCEVEGNCCCTGQVFLNTIRSLVIVKSRIIAAVEVKFFEYHPLLDNCEFVGAL